MALFKMVNGERIQMTAEEEQAHLDQQAVDAARQAARDREQETLDQMHDLIRALVKEIADGSGRTPAQVMASMKVTLQGM